MEVEGTSDGSKDGLFEVEGESLGIKLGELVSVGVMEG